MSTPSISTCDGASGEDPAARCFGPDRAVELTCIDATLTTLLEGLTMPDCGS